MRQVFCETAHGLALKHRYGEVRLLLQCIQVHCQSKTVNMDAMNDDIVMAAVKELAKQTRDVRKMRENGCVCVCFLWTTATFKGRYSIVPTKIQNDRLFSEQSLQFGDGYSYFVVEVVFWGWGSPHFPLYYEL